jgi:hypothetical protein
MAISDRRDLRIDFFRGLTLYTVLIDHIERNPVAGFTFHRFGFSDGAEAFIFLSGISCGIAYSNLLERRGWPAVMAALARRATWIYFFYVVTSAATILFVWLIQDPLRAADALTGDRFAFAENPYSAMWSAALLTKQPSLPGILVLYLPLTLAALPLFLAVTRLSSALALFVSCAIWLLPQLKLLAADQSSLLFPYFNPIAWQFLFCIGMSFGMRHRSDKSIPVSRCNTWHLVAAWTIVVFGLLWCLYPVVAKRAGWHLDWYRSLEMDGYSKYNLSMLRLIHFLSVSSIVAAYVSPRAGFLRWGNECIIKAGRNSLEVFSLGTFLSVLGSVVFLIFVPTLAQKIAFNIALVLVTALAAFGLSDWSSRHRAKYESG